MSKIPRHTAFYCRGSKRRFGDNQHGRKRRAELPPRVTAEFIGEAARRSRKVCNIAEYLAEGGGCGDTFCLDYFSVRIGNICGNAACTLGSNEHLRIYRKIFEHGTVLYSVELCVKADRSFARVFYIKLRGGQKPFCLRCVFEPCVYRIRGVKAVYHSVYRLDRFCVAGIFRTEYVAYVVTAYKNKLRLGKSGECCQSVFRGELAAFSAKTD